MELDLSVFNIHMFYLVYDINNICVVYFMYKVDSVFDLDFILGYRFVIIMVFLNTCVLTSEHYNQPEWLDHFQGNPCFITLTNK